VENPYISFFSHWTFQQHLLNMKSENKFSKSTVSGKNPNYNFESKVGVYQLNPKVVLIREIQAKLTREDEVPFILNDERTTNTSFIYNPSYYWAPRAANG
jgi:hypothetical protein